LFVVEINIMTSIELTLRSGQVVHFAAQRGQTLMHAIRDAGAGDLMALCGGGCSCATCHVYIDAPAAGDLPSIESQENDLLDCSTYREANSRLSCQVTLNESLQSLRVRIAPEE
jgi:2Fe-2S ferredoxin